MVRQIETQLTIDMECDRWMGAINSDGNLGLTPVNISYFEHNQLLASEEEGDIAT